MFLRIIHLTEKKAFNICKKKKKTKKTLKQKTPLKGSTIRIHEFLKILESTTTKKETQNVWFVPNKFPPFFYKEL